MDVHTLRDGSISSSSIKGVFSLMKNSMVRQLLVKYSEKVGAAFHRQLKLPLRVSVKGGLRVCSLKVRQ